MRVSKPSDGALAWHGLIAYIFIVDGWLYKTHRETMSHCFGRYWYIGIPSAILVFKHLAAPGVLPEIDPIKWTAWAIRINEH